VVGTITGQTTEALTKGRTNSPQGNKISKLSRIVGVIKSEEDFKPDVLPIALVFFRCDHQMLPAESWEKKTALQEW
jgi:hypothetical protein